MNEAMKKHFDNLQGLLNAAVQKGIFNDAQSVIVCQQALNELANHIDQIKYISNGKEQISEAATN